MRFWIIPENGKYTLHVLTDTKHRTRIYARRCRASEAGERYIRRYRTAEWDVSAIRAKLVPEREAMRLEAVAANPYLGQGQDGVA